MIRPTTRASARIACALVALQILVLFGHGFAGVAVAEKQPGLAFYAEPTGHVLRDAFLVYWRQHQGMTTLGLPVSEVISTGNARAQFFEFGLLESKCDLDCTHLIRRLPIGVQLLKAVAGPPDNSSAALQGEFAAFYQVNGGRQRFGKPLTSAYHVGESTVQWFRFGRLEEDSNGKIKVAKIGSELAELAGVDLSPVTGGELPALDLQRYRRHTGDGTVPLAVQTFVPNRIEIPSIGVEAKVDPIEIVDGVMGVPADPENVGWYPAISRPGEDSNVVMTGHKDWWGVGPTIFANLAAVHPGDAIYLTGSDGSGFVYDVVRVYSVPADANPEPIISNDEGTETLTLLTCDGTFNGAEYESRLVVRAVRR